MEEAYLSTFNPSEKEEVKYLLEKEINDIEFELDKNRFKVYKTSRSAKEIVDKNYLTNSFIVIKRFDELTGSYFKPIFQWLGRHSFENLKNIKNKLGFKSFRIVINDNNKMVSTHRRAVKAMERKISYETEMAVDRVNPDTEIWIMHTKDKFGFILFKIS